MLDGSEENEDSSFDEGEDVLVNEETEYSEDDYADFNPAEEKVDAPVKNPVLEGVVDEEAAKLVDEETLYEE